MTGEEFLYKGVNFLISNPDSSKILFVLLSKLFKASSFIKLYDFDYIFDYDKESADENIFETGQLNYYYIDEGLEEIGFQFLKEENSYY